MSLRHVIPTNLNLNRLLLVLNHAASELVAKGLLCIQPLQCVHGLFAYQTRQFLAEPVSPRTLLSRSDIARREGIIAPSFRVDWNNGSVRLNVGGSIKNIHSSKSATAPHRPRILFFQREQGYIGIIDNTTTHRTTTNRLLEKICKKQLEIYVWYDIASSLHDVFRVMWFASILRSRLNTLYRQSKYFPIRVLCGYTALIDAFSTPNRLDRVLG